MSEICTFASRTRSCWWFVGIGTGNPGVFQGYPYPYPRKPVPVFKGTGFPPKSHTISQSTKNRVEPHTTSCVQFNPVQKAVLTDSATTGHHAARVSQNQLSVHKYIQPMALQVYTTWSAFRRLLRIFRSIHVIKH